MTKRHDSASGSWIAAVGTVRSSGKPSSQRVGVNEVRECALPVDLDHGQVLSVPRLESRLAADVDEIEVESELVVGTAHDFKRPLAQLAVRSVIERDVAYGYRPLVVVASATRCTASPYEAMRKLISRLSRVCQASSNERPTMSRSFALTSSSLQKYS